MQTNQMTQKRDAETALSLARAAAASAFKSWVDADAECDRLRAELREAYREGLAWRDALRAAMPEHPAIVEAEAREAKARAIALDIAERDAERAAEAWEEHYSVDNDSVL